MAVALPTDAAQVTPEDTERLRYAARSKDGAGFLFLNNYQDHVAMRDHEGIRLCLELQDESLVFPQGQGLMLRKHVSAILPFNMRLEGGVLLKYATAQALTLLRTPEQTIYVFFAPEGMRTELAFDRATYQTIEVTGGICKDGNELSYVFAEPGLNCSVRITRTNGIPVQMLVLTQEQAHACLLMGTLAACGGGSSNNGPVTITFWSWVPNLQKAVDLFEKSYPNIKVKLENVGAGGNEYTKLTTALKAKSGAPDVVQLTYEELPTYELSNYLVDLSPYGAGALKSDYVDWAWAQYAQEAIQLHQENPKIYMTDFPSSDGSWFTALLWQAGSRPYKVNGTTISLHMDDDPALQVADYWGNLVKSGAVSTGQDFTNDWNAGLANGTIATWITAAWAPTDLEGTASGTTGKWRVAPLPQWTAGAQVSSNWGGSTDAVTVQSKHPAEAAEFAEFLNHDQASASLLTQQLSLFPTLKSVLTAPSFSAPVNFYGGQQVNSIFVQSSQEVDTSFQWSPFQDYAYTQMTNQLAGAVSGKITFEQAMHNAQQAVVSYAQAQGFTVTS